MLTTDATGGARSPAGRRVAPRWLGMALCCGIAAVVATEAAAAPACLRPDERAAIEVRVVQTGLMVAALSCNFQPTYNQFMLRFHKTLNRHTATMHRFFDRTYGAGGTSRATRYFTSVANRTALTSVADIDKFCNEFGGRAADGAGRLPGQARRVRPPAAGGHPRRARFRALHPGRQLTLSTS